MIPQSIQSKPSGTLDEPKANFHSDYLSFGSVFSEDTIDVIVPPRFAQPAVSATGSDALVALQAPKVINQKFQDSLGNGAGMLGLGKELNFILDNAKKQLEEDALQVRKSENVLDREITGKSSLPIQATSERYDGMMVGSSVQISIDEQRDVPEASATKNEEPRESMLFGSTSPYMYAEKTFLTIFARDREHTISPHTARSPSTRWNREESRNRLEQKYSTLSEENMISYPPAMKIENSVQVLEKKPENLDISRNEIEKSPLGNHSSTGSMAIPSVSETECNGGETKIATASETKPSNPAVTIVDYRAVEQVEVFGRIERNNMNTIASPRKEVITLDVFFKKEKPQDVVMQNEAIAIENVSLLKEEKSLFADKIETVGSDDSSSTASCSVLSPPHIQSSHKSKSSNVEKHEPNQAFGEILTKLSLSSMKSKSKISSKEQKVNEDSLSLKSERNETSVVSLPKQHVNVTRPKTPVTSPLLSSLFQTAVPPSTVHQETSAGSTKSLCPAGTSSNEELKNGAAKDPSLDRSVVNLPTGTIASIRNTVSVDVFAANEEVEWTLSPKSDSKLQLQPDPKNTQESKVDSYSNQLVSGTTLIDASAKTPTQSTKEYKSLIDCDTQDSFFEYDVNDSEIIQISGKSIEANLKTIELSKDTTVMAEGLQKDDDSSAKVSDDASSKKKKIFSPVKIGKLAMLIAGRKLSSSSKNANRKSGYVSRLKEKALTKATEAMNEILNESVEEGKEDLPQEKEEKSESLTRVTTVTNAVVSGTLERTENSSQNVVESSTTSVENHAQQLQHQNIRADEEVSSFSKKIAKGQEELQKSLEENNSTLSEENMISYPPAMTKPSNPNSTHDLTEQFNSSEKSKQNSQSSSNKKYSIESKTMEVLQEFASFIASAMPAGENRNNDAGNESLSIVQGGIGQFEVVEIEYKNQTNDVEQEQTKNIDQDKSTSTKNMNKPQQKTSNDKLQSIDPTTVQPIMEIEVTDSMNQRSIETSQIHFDELSIKEETTIAKKPYETSQPKNKFGLALKNLFSRSNKATTRGGGCALPVFDLNASSDYNTVLEKIETYSFETSFIKSPRTKQVMDETEGHLANVPRNINVASPRRYSESLSRFMPQEGRKQNKVGNVSFKDKILDLDISIDDTEPADGSMLSPQNSMLSPQNSVMSPKSKLCIHEAQSQLSINETETMQETPQLKQSKLRVVMEKEDESSNSNNATIKETVVVIGKAQEADNKNEQLQESFSVVQKDVNLMNKDDSDLVDNSSLLQENNEDVLVQPTKNNVTSKIDLSLQTKQDDKHNKVEPSRETVVKSESPIVVQDSTPSATVKEVAKESLSTTLKETVVARSGDKAKHKHAKPQANDREKTESKSSKKKDEHKKVSTETTTKEHGKTNTSHVEKSGSTKKNKAKVDTSKVSSPTSQHRSPSRLGSNNGGMKTIKEAPGKYRATEGPTPKARNGTDSKPVLPARTRTSEKDNNNDDDRQDKHNKVHTTNNKSTSIKEQQDVHQEKTKKTSGTKSETKKGTDGKEQDARQTQKLEKVPGSAKDTVVESATSDKVLRNKDMQQQLQQSKQQLDSNKKIEVDANKVDAVLANDTGTLLSTVSPRDRKYQFSFDDEESTLKILCKIQEDNNEIQENKEPNFQTATATTPGDDSLNYEMSSITSKKKRFGLGGLARRRSASTPMTRPRRLDKQSHTTSGGGGSSSLLGDDTVTTFVRDVSMQQKMRVDATSDEDVDNLSNNDDDDNETEPGGVTSSFVRELLTPRERLCVDEIARDAGLLPTADHHIIGGGGGGLVVGRSTRQNVPATSNTRHHIPAPSTTRKQNQQQHQHRPKDEDETSFSSLHGVPRVISHISRTVSEDSVSDATTPTYHTNEDGNTDVRRRRRYHHEMQTNGEHIHSNKYNSYHRPTPTRKIRDRVHGKASSAKFVQTTTDDEASYQASKTSSAHYSKRSKLTSSSTSRRKPTTATRRTNHHHYYSNDDNNADDHHSYNTGSKLSKTGGVSTSYRTNRSKPKPPKIDEVSVSHSIRSIQQSYDDEDDDDDDPYEAQERDSNSWALWNVGSGWLW